MKPSFLLSIFIVIISTTSVFSQKDFPEIKGKSLNDKQVTLPQKGKHTLIGIAYSKKAEEDLNTWFNPVYNTFLKPVQSSFLPTASYDVNIYFVPMITGIAQAAGDKIEEKMKKGVDKELHPYVVLYEGEIKSYKDQLNMSEKDQPYFFVLDSEGKIVYSCSGKYTESKMEKILEIVEE